MNLTTYLSRVLVNINVNNSSMFVALFNHIILDLSGPVGIIFSEKDSAKSLKAETVSITEPNKSLQFVR